MQSNLLFFGLSEPAENIRNRGSRENTDYMVKFMRNEMAFEGSASLDVDTIEFDRIHRLGRPKFDGNGRLLKPRPVVASEYEPDAYKIIALKRSKCRGGGICILIKKWLEKKS